MALILDRYPLDYRSEIITRLTPLIQRGESMCLVGLAGVGKSNLATFLQQPEVKANYFKSEAERTDVVYLSCLPGGQPKDEVLNGLLLRTWRVVSKAKPDLSELPSTDRAPLYALQNLLEDVCRVRNRRVVYVLDEFESLIRHQPPGIFDDFRALRDEHRTSGNVVFIIITNRMPQLVPGPDRFASGKFFQILRNNVFCLPPYRDVDADSMLNVLLKQDGNADIDAQDRARLLLFSGGHSWLLAALFKQLAPTFHASARDYLQLVTSSVRVNWVCEQIWLSLHAEEQQALQAIVRQQPVSEPMLGFLETRGLIRDRNTPVLFSPLFQEYIQQVKLAGP